MRKIATILSTLFHPLLMPTYGIAIALYTSHMRNLQSELLGGTVLGIALMTCLLPTIGIFLLYKTEYISDYRLHNRRERTLPYLLCLFCYICSYMFLSRIHAPKWILSFMACAVVSLIIVLLINRFWKISAHMTAAGALVALVFIMTFEHLMLSSFVQPMLIIAILLAGAIGSSRILLGRHTLAQVVAGFIWGVGCCTTLFLIFT